MKKIIFLLIFSSSLSSQAIETDKYAHAGISFAITTVSYGFCKSFFDLDNREDTPKWPCVLGAGIFSTMLSTVKEVTDPVNDRDDFFANFVGNFTAGITLTVFNF